jgi:hypothetical protein
MAKMFPNIPLLAGLMSNARQVALSDTFNRISVSGWGTATDGNIWTEQAAFGTSMVDATNFGQVFNTGVGGNCNFTLSAKIFTNTETLFRWQIGDNANEWAAAIVRYIDSNNFYRLGFGTPISTGICTFRKKVAGVFTAIASVAFIPINGTKYWCRARVQNNTFYCNLWQDGTIEPVGWTLGPVTDSDLASGMCGIQLSDQSNRSLSRVDSYTVMLV